MSLRSFSASLAASKCFTSLRLVVGDLQKTSPDLILQGGDLADAGASPVEIVDHIRDLGCEV